jgi:sigma-B regulation protein RsbU (phosphoserine phosphatase)
LQSRNVIHAFARENRSPAEVLSKANSVIYEDYSRADMFLSAFYSTIDVRSRNLRYASAGHNPPLLLRADGTCSSLDSTGCLLGISPNLSIAEKSVPLGASDILALYTDGLSEARDHTRSQFGCERLARKLAEYRELPAREIADRIVQEAASFAGHDQFDDATLVVIKVEPVE